VRSGRTFFLAAGAALAAVYALTDGNGQERHPRAVVLRSAAPRGRAAGAGVRDAGARSRWVRRETTDAGSGTDAATPAEGRRTRPVRVCPAPAALAASAAPITAMSARRTSTNTGRSTCVAPHNPVRRDRRARSEPRHPDRRPSALEPSPTPRARPRIPDTPTAH
jgi:hypothetical protein